MKKIQGSNITIEDILKYSGVGGYKGKAHSELIDDLVEVTDYEHCLGMFLFDVENRIMGEGDGLEKLDPKKLVGKDKKEIMRYFQGKIDSVLAMYMEIYGINRDNLVGKKEVIIDTRNMFSRATGIFTIQHLLRINGYEIDSDEMTKTIKDKLTSGGQVKIKIPIRYMGKRLDEKEVLNRFNMMQYEGRSIIKSEVLPRIEVKKKRT